MQRDLILIVTNRRDLTADYLILELQRRQVRYARVNTEDIPTQLRMTYDPTGRHENPVLESAFQCVSLEEVRSVWYRRPCPPSVSLDIPVAAERSLAEAETAAAIEGLWHVLDCYWVSRPVALREAESKPLQLAVAQELGFSIPATLVTNCPSRARAFLSRFPKTVCKPLRTGQIEYADETRGLIYTHLLDPAEQGTLDNVAYASTLLQEHVPKQNDIRVTIIGNTVFAVAIASQEHASTKTDWRRGNPLLLHHSVHELPSEVASISVELLRAFDLEFGAIDLIQRPDGDYTFLELNPNGQWAWLQQMLPELPLRETLAALLLAGGERP